MKVAKGQWIAWMLHSGSTWLSMGNPTGGTPHEAESSEIVSRIVGGKVQRTPGRYGFSGSVTGNVTPDTFTFLESLLPTAGVLPEIAVASNTGHRVRVHDPATPKSWSLKGQQGGVLTFDTSWVTPPPLAATTPPSARVDPADSTEFSDTQWAIEVNGTAYTVISFGIQVEHDTKQHPGGARLGTTGTRRAYSGEVSYNSEPDITIDLEFEEDVDPTDVFADCPDAGSLVLTVSALCGDPAFGGTLTIGNVKWVVPKGESLESDGSAVVPWSVSASQSTYSAPVFDFE